MSQPPKSTILAPSSRWTALSGVALSAAVVGMKVNFILVVGVGMLAGGGRTGRDCGRVNGAIGYFGRSTGGSAADQGVCPTGTSDGDFAEAAVGAMEFDSQVDGGECGGEDSKALGQGAQ